MTLRPTILVFIMFVGNVALQASTLQAGFSESQFGGASANISSPTAMAFAPDGRLFICQQDGRLRVIKQGSLLSTPFLTVSVDSQGERGLLGVAFDPGFSTNSFVYIYYTTPGPPLHNRISRFTASGDIAVAGSEVVLIDLDNLSTATNHNGGGIHFGKDGKLYAGVGENANSSNAQSLSTVLGKILRINSDGSIPADNPFFTQTSGKNRAIWALGLRNPFTFNFQPDSGRLFINDVGEGTWEEVDEGVAGANYGWPICEGVCGSPQPQLTNPIFAYSHASTNGCAITGATFYNPSVSNFPASYVGKYFFADLCGGFVRLMDPDSHAVSTFATGLQQPVDLQVGPDGALYYLQIGNGGQVWRVSFDSGSGGSSGGGSGGGSTASGRPVQGFLSARLVPSTDGTDSDGDGKTDLTVFRRTSGNWLVRRSSDGGSRTQQWGAPGDIAVPGDYDGDGRSDFAVWRKSDGTWYVLQSSNGTSITRQWGAAGDIPVPGDYDGDGKTDFAVWRRSTGTWYVILSSSGAITSQQWGMPGDIPVPGDYDGDGRTDLAIWRESEGAWYVIQSSNRVRYKKQWGLPGDIPLVADFDGDRKSDFVVWRESEGNWYVLQSSNGAPVTRKLGLPGDIPVPGDYDGDGKSDYAVWRESEGNWYVIQSSNGAAITSPLGGAGDSPVSAPAF